MLVAVHVLAEGFVKPAGTSVGYLGTVLEQRHNLMVQVVPNYLKDHYCALVMRIMQVSPQFQRFKLASLAQN
jgi:hypothetical protein